MTDDTLLQFILIIAIFIGEVALTFLICLLHAADYPAPFWRWVERCWDTILRGMSRTYQAIGATALLAYSKTPHGKRTLAAEKARHSSAAARHRDAQFARQIGSHK